MRAIPQTFGPGARVKVAIEDVQSPSDGSIIRDQVVVRIWSGRSSIAAAVPAPIAAQLFTGLGAALGLQLAPATPPASQRT